VIVRTIDRVQPAWVCAPCGQRYGSPLQPTIAYDGGDHCDVCGQMGVTMAASDYGSLDPNWQHHPRPGHLKRTTASRPLEITT